MSCWGRMRRRGGDKTEGEGGSNKTKGGGGSNKKKGGGSNKGKFDVQKLHSAHLDKDNSGMTTDAAEYEYGTPIEAAIDTTVLTSLDVATMGNWKLGIFMHIADPQDG
mmetsp:Transcript_14611/g.31779  ORF Transcript_14611/g.31779 Transcript_14611/m.31779 type:complete len:108 (-) Transcript_14611:195-518(-)